MNENIQYENRLIAFVDLLGFKNAVENSIKSDEIRKCIIYAIKQNERLKKDNYDDSFYPLQYHAITRQHTWENALNPC